LQPDNVRAGTLGIEAPVTDDVIDPLTWVT
jgi:hypothetical protein